MPRRTLFPPMMSTTVTVMSSPTTKVSPILRVSTSTVRPPWRSFLASCPSAPGSPSLASEQDDVRRLVLAHRDRRRAVLRAEQRIARRVALDGVQDLPRRALLVVHDDGREEVDRRLAHVGGHPDDAVDRDLVCTLDLEPAHV